MPIDSTEVRLAPTGKVKVAPTGTVLPTNATMATNASFKDLGYVDEDGVSLTPGVELTDIAMWQSAVPVKTTLDTVTFEVQFNMGQVNQDTWSLYFFVAGWTNNFGQAKLIVPTNPGSQEKSLIIEWTDDLGDDTRLVIPTAVLTDREALQLTRSTAQLTGITFRALDTSGVLAYVYSDNPDLVPSS